MFTIAKLLNSSQLKFFPFPKTTTNPSYGTKSEATFEIEQDYKLHKLDDGPAKSITLAKKEAVKLYADLFMLRHMENAANMLYKAKLARGFCHLYSGEEAVGVGIRSMMRDKDSLITAYRCHGWAYLMGVSPSNILAELTGRQTGCSRGKGGSMHMYAPKFYGGNAIVGAQVPLGTGVAFAHKYMKDSGVCFVIYGDGAANQGQVFEAFNLAKLWNLPCVFVCENNDYGMGTKTNRAAASTDYYTRGDYIPGVWVDGMDTIAVREATRFAVEHVISGKGPIIIETKTYRYHGHSMSDPGTTYRTREEVEEMRKKHDPIICFRKRMIDAQLIAPDEVKVIESKIKKFIKTAVEHAKSDPITDVEELSADIYKKCCEANNLIRGVHPQAPMKHINLQM